MIAIIWRPRKTTWHLFYPTSSFVHPFVAICEFKLELASANAQFGSKSLTFRDREIWRITLKSYKTRLLCHFKLCASFGSPLLIQAGVTVRKFPNWGKIDLWLMTLICCMHITLIMEVIPKTFMKIPWQEHCEKDVTDGQTDVHRAVWSGLKMNKP